MACRCQRFTVQNRKWRYFDRTARALRQQQHPAVHRTTSFPHVLRLRHNKKYQQCEYEINDQSLGHSWTRTSHLSKQREASTSMEEALCKFAVHVYPTGAFQMRQPDKRSDGYGYCLSSSGSARPRRHDIASRAFSNRDSPACRVGGGVNNQTSVAREVC